MDVLSPTSPDGKHFKSLNKQAIEHVFDLKGSLVARNVKKGDKSGSTTLKDINFLKLQASLQLDAHKLQPLK